MMKPQQQLFNVVLVLSLSVFLLLSTTVDHARLTGSSASIVPEAASSSSSATTPTPTTTTTTPAHDDEKKDATNYHHRRQLSSSSSVNNCITDEVSLKNAIENSPFQYEWQLCSDNIIVTNPINMANQMKQIKCNHSYLSSSSTTSERRCKITIHVLHKQPDAGFYGIGNNDDISIAFHDVEFTHGFTPIDKNGNQNGAMVRFLEVLFSLVM